MRLRPPAAVAAGLLVAVLTGCEQPTPSVTVFSGASSDHREAVCWTDPAEQVDTRECLTVSGGEAGGRLEELRDSLGEVTVRSDATIGISVDAEVEERGWYVTLGTNRVNVEPIRDSYYRFSLPSKVVEQGEPIPLYVLAVNGDSDEVTGAWAFELVPAEGSSTDDR